MGQQVTSEDCCSYSTHISGDARGQVVMVTVHRDAFVTAGYRSSTGWMALQLPITLSNANQCHGKSEQNRHFDSKINKTNNADILRFQGTRNGQNVHVLLISD